MMRGGDQEPTLALGSQIQLLSSFDVPHVRALRHHCVLGRLV